jgi:Carboxypeptidase regulatory-like domain
MAMRRTFQSLLLAALLFGSLLSTKAQDRRGRKYVPPPDTSKITITVTRETSGKPIRNAAVIFHPIKNGKDDGTMELKTDEDGKTSIDVIPIGGTVRLQIIANGFQTFGNDYTVTTATKDIVVKMKRPVEQYSIYKGNGTGDQSGQATEKTTGTSQSQQSKQDQQPK